MRTLPEVLDELTRRGVTLTLRADGKLILEGPFDSDLAADCRHHRDLLAWAVLGRASGHEWLSCDRCGQVQLLTPDKTGRPCHLTYGCKGHLRRLGTVATPKQEAS